MIGRAQYSTRSLSNIPRAAPERPHWGAHVIRAALRRLRRARCSRSRWPAAAAATNWTTRDVPEEYPTIQAAVDAAQPGDLVRIGPGTYREQVVVGPAKRDVVLRGTDRNRVVLDGGGGDALQRHHRARRRRRRREPHRPRLRLRRRRSSPRPRARASSSTGGARASSPPPTTACTGSTRSRSRGGTIDHVVRLGPRRGGPAHRQLPPVRLAGHRQRGRARHGRLRGLGLRRQRRRRALVLPRQPRRRAARLRRRGGSPSTSRTRPWSAT